jgi:hypothetical protein
VHGGHLDVFVARAAVHILVLDAHVREVHLVVEVRQLVLPRPGRDLDRVTVRTAVAVPPVPVALLRNDWYSRFSS